MSTSTPAILIQDFLALPGESVLLDARSPGEYAHGHIPGAVNLPLFDDAERAEVGTLYKQKSPESAFERGLEIAGSKMADYVKIAKKLAPAGDVLIHCWRGGKRSESLAWLLDLSGFSVRIIKGGYKAYRNYIHNVFEETDARFIVIGGKTGVGKTDVLDHLKNRDEQILDLEGLANHKGSAFGALGQLPQPTTEQFENQLFKAFSKLDVTKRIWLENESRTIGTVYLPDNFLAKMKSAVLINVELPMEMRVKRLVIEYAGFSDADLIDAFQKIERRLGGQNLKLALEAIHSGDFGQATEIALRYYDKTYLHAVNRWPFSKRIELKLEENKPGEAAGKLIEIADAENL